MTHGKRCVYTALVGQYEALNEQPIARESGLPFICFTDDPSLRSETWEVRPIDLLFRLDAVRSQREVKLRPHKYLPEFSSSLYIDNSVILKETPERVFERYAPASGLALVQHSYRSSVIDEFHAVHAAGYDDSARILEQLNHYALSRPEVLEQKPLWGGIQIRDHEDETVRDFLDAWRSHVLRYSRRDQLSVNYVMAELGFTPDIIEVDNHNSWFHTWPTKIGRLTTSRSTLLDPIVQPAARLREFKSDIGALQVYHQTLEAVLTGYDRKIIQGSTIQERLDNLRPYVKKHKGPRLRASIRRTLLSFGRRIAGSGKNSKSG